MFLSCASKWLGSKMFSPYQNMLFLFPPFWVTCPFHYNWFEYTNNTGIMWAVRVLAFNHLHCMAVHTCISTKNQYILSKIQSMIVYAVFCDNLTEYFGEIYMISYELLPVKLLR